MKTLKRIGVCTRCGMCCKGFTLTMDKVIDRDRMKYYKLHNTDFTLKNGKTILRFNMVCSAFDPKTKNCKVYLNRPVFCMKFPQPEDADKLPKECGFRFVEEEI